MYSGTLGTEFHADIYLGVVYYQRLRHMVKDKYQVRSTGPVNKVTRQPLKVRTPNISSPPRHLQPTRDVKLEEEFDSEKWSEIHCWDMVLLS